MASSSHFLLIVLLLPALAASSNTGNISVYWGQHGYEGSLAEACNTNLYGYVIIAFLNVFGNNQIPGLNLAGHCTPSSGNCKYLSSQILQCKSKGIKVLLSLGGANGNYSLTSPADVDFVGSYLWDNYLGGSSGSRPLGDAVLDGIDFDIENLGSSGYYGELAKLLVGFGKRAGIKVYLSAAPHCSFPDREIGPALEAVTFDYLWPQFYNDPNCDYSSGVTGIAGEWSKWTSRFKNSTVFLGLLGSKNAPGTGYIPPNDLISNVLPVIKKASNYGGIRLWNRYLDRTSGYSYDVKARVKVDQSELIEIM